YWSITRYDDIKAVDMDHDRFSSEGGITIANEDEDFRLPMFIAMDRPKHDDQRKVVAPVAGPRNLAAMESVIRQRAGDILDSLPVGETFDWVDRVSIEQTTQMLATLFDFPFEDRRKLTRWSDVATAGPGSGIVESEEQRRAELMECLEYFTNLWNERVNKAPGNDLISMLAHGESTKNMPPLEYLGNLILLIVGGNDTTRNTLSGSVLALNQNRDQFDKLKADHSLIPNMVSETIRWQTPLAHMRRTANCDVVMGGKTIRKGDKVIMWYASGNRDERQFENPDAYLVDRPNARSHIAFGFGVHRCMGNRVAEMQLRIVWEEFFKRFSDVEVVAEPELSYSTFVKGYNSLPVRLTAK
ncbi:MAG: cytochrome P450, partial [Pseudomonadales bacterium]